MLQNENLSKLDELSESAKELENDGAKFMDPGSKRKRGRPKGPSKTQAEATKAERVEAAPQGPPTTEIVRPVITLLSGWTARLVKDDRAAMLPEEQETITVCTAGLIDKYAMSLGKYAVEIAFAATVGAYGLRVIAINETNKEDRRKRERDQFGGPDPRANGASGPGRPVARVEAKPDPRAYTQDIAL